MRKSNFHLKKSCSFPLLAGSIAVGVLLAGGVGQAHAALTSLTLFSDYQTYVASGSQADTNYYGKGAMMLSANVADPGVGYSTPRTMDALFSFNTATASTGKTTGYVTSPATGIDIKSAFNDTYGIGKWSITSASITLNSNFYVEGIQPNNSDFNRIASGLFSLNLLGSNPDLTTTTWNTLQSYLPTTTSTSIGTFQWNAQPVGTPNNQNSEPGVTYNLALNDSLISALLAGELTLMGVAADDKVGYLFNTANRIAPQLTITADVTPTPTPIPAAAWLLGSGLLGLVGIRRRNALS